MAMYKAAQMFDQANDEFVVALPMAVEEPSTEVVLYDEVPVDAEESVEMQIPQEDSIEFSFKLPVLPGAADDFEVQLDESAELESQKEEKPKAKEEGQPKNLDWLKEVFDKIPQHHGETLGLERVKSYLSKALNQLCKMVQEDHECKIDISKAEDARIEMENGIERLDRELTKRRKKASTSSDLTKEGQKAAGIGTGGVLVTVPLIVSAIARLCINSTISGGKSIEDTFQRLAKKWKLSDREKLEVIQLLADMNFPIRRDMGFMVDDDEKYKHDSENNYNLPPNYQA